ncbi:MAG: hypothetical protein E7330_02440 [Clostridiales bacterium]|nr:hypothetical protein [Clostridiales bacterium]
MVNVLYEDNHLLVVEKPVNIPVQADSSGDRDLLTTLKEYIREKYEKPGEVYLGLVHRLDRPVGGVMVFARTSKAASRLQDAFSGHRDVKKRYCALVEGTPKAEEKLTGFIARDEKKGTAWLADKRDPGAKPASLFYRKAAEKNGLSLLDIDLFTGRHHQIRLQTAGNRTPIWGDQRYNKNAKPGQQIALWAYSLTFPHPTKKEPMTFVSLPQGGAWAAFHEALEGLAADISVVFEDENILAVNKPRSIGVAAADGANSLEERLRSLYGDVRPVHRLDVQTAGLLLFAKNETAEEALLAAIKERRIRKFYRCTVRGVPEPKEATGQAYLLKDAGAAHVKIFDEPRPGAKEILTRYRVLTASKGKSTLEVELLTGRTHQIRAHMAHLGHPLLGDDRYGDRSFNRQEKADHLSLTAVRLIFDFEASSPLAYLNGRVIELFA